MSDRLHRFQPLHMNDAVTAACSCGWVSAYAHAFVKYAREDHDFHARTEIAKLPAVPQWCPEWGLP